MQMFLSLLICCSLTMTIISLIYIGVIPLLSKRYSSKWLYYIWLLIVIGWIIPFRPDFKANIVPEQIANIRFEQQKYVILSDQLNVVPDVTKDFSSVPVLTIIIGIWVVGAVIMSVYHIYRHRRFLKMVKRWSSDITNSVTIQICDTLKSELTIKAKIGLKTCQCISSPMMIGFLHPTILLPHMNYAPDELMLILRHELIHLRRNDLWYKAVVLIACIIHWFNPMVYFMARAVELQCELSCDELLVREKSLQLRMQYGETLIGAIRRGTKIHTALSTDFYSPGRFIKTRIYRIMDTTKKGAALVALCFIFMAVIGSGIAYASDIRQGSSADTIINVNVDSLKEGNIICFRGPYELKAGDVIQYNMTSQSSNNIYVEFIRTDSVKFGTSVMTQSFRGYIMPFKNYRTTVSKTTEGEFCLFIKFANLASGNHIKGTIQIMKGEGNS